MSNAENPKDASYEIDGTITFNEDSTIDFGTGSITSTGKIISKTKHSALRPGAILTIYKGDSPSSDSASSEADESTGTYHNHGILDLYKGAKIEGNGKIINYAKFEDDTENNQKVSTTYSATASLTTKEDLAHATYFDLVNDEEKGVATGDFQIFSGAEIRSTTENFGDATKFNMIGLGNDQLNVTLDVVSEGFSQTTGELTTAYNLASAAKYNKTYSDKNFETELKSVRPDEVRTSFYSLEGYTQYASEQTDEYDEDDEFDDLMPTEVEEGYYGTNEELEKGTKFKFHLQNVNSLGGDATSDSSIIKQIYTPIYIPEVDQSIVISKTIDPDAKTGKKKKRNKFYWLTNTNPN